MDHSFLKEILDCKKCSVINYMAHQRYLNEVKTFDDYYITQVKSCSGIDLLIISHKVKGSWYEAILHIDSAARIIKQQYDSPNVNHKLILHVFFEIVELEKFYLIDTNEKYVFNAVKVCEFEKMLD
ncbi:MAG: hypothetical protein IT280_10260 [Ignavibacteria bacterium]|nr:hypothetical protein [Ignavibacteria bacterium]